MKPRGSIPMQKCKCYSSEFPQEIEMATSCPVTSYWLTVYTHSCKNSTTMCGNHGNRKVNALTTC